MEAQYGEVLSEVILRINTIIDKKHVVNREVLGAINTIAARICEDPPNAEHFAAFLKEAHDWFTKFESPMRAMILRIMRLCSSSRAHCAAIVDEEMHWITTVCMEREQEYLVERMQALKLVKKFIQHMGDAFPIAFARSLVAIATTKDDNIRRVCLETLRELSIENPRIVCMVNGLPTLVDAILEPATADMAEQILVSLLYLLNDPKSRRFIRPYLDLRSLLSPFTDLDTEPAELSLRWKTARAAFVTVMRSWTGIIQLTSDDLGLPMLVRLLRDTKVSADVQDAILDAIAEVFEPVISKVRKVRGSLQTVDLNAGGSGASAGTLPSQTQGRQTRSYSGSAVHNNNNNSDSDNNNSQTAPAERRRLSGADISSIVASSNAMSSSSSSSPSRSAIAVLPLNDVALDPDDILRTLEREASSEESISRRSLASSSEFFLDNPAKVPGLRGPSSTGSGTGTAGDANGSNKSTGLPGTSYATAAPSAVLGGGGVKASPAPAARSSGFNFAYIFGSSPPFAGKPRGRGNSAAASTTSGAGGASSLAVGAGNQVSRAHSGTTPQPNGGAGAGAEHQYQQQQQQQQAAEKPSVKTPRMFGGKDTNNNTSNTTASTTATATSKWSKGGGGSNSQTISGSGSSGGGGGGGIASMLFGNAPHKQVGNAAMVTPKTVAAKPAAAAIDTTNARKGVVAGGGAAAQPGGVQNTPEKTTTDTTPTARPVHRPSLTLNIPMMQKMSDDPDPLFNLLDNYAAILCCAFIHAEIVPSLCHLSVQGVFSVATKARRLLISFLLVVAKIFPDSTCAQLLTLPSLLNFSAAYTPGIKPSHSHKASQVLIALADALSMAPYEPLSASGVENRISNVTDIPGTVFQGHTVLQATLLQNSGRTTLRAGTASIPASTVMGSTVLNPSAGSSSLAVGSTPSSSKFYAGNSGLGNVASMRNGGGGGAPLSPGGAGGGGGGVGGAHPVSWDLSASFTTSSNVKTIRDLAEELRVFTRTRVNISQQDSHRLKATHSDHQLVPTQGFSASPGSSGTATAAGGGTGNSGGTGSHKQLRQSVASTESWANAFSTTGSSTVNLKNLKSRGLCSQSKSELMQQMRIMLTPTVDKNEFNRQMESSKVMGKDGRDPSRWDWAVIADMLEIGFQTPERISEAVHKRWIKRVVGFFHCNTEEVRSPFASLEWDPGNLVLLECACNLFNVLTEDEVGMATLKHERKALLFNEMTKEMEQLVINLTAGSSGLLSSRPGVGAVAPQTRNVFRLSSCSHTMARELFTILGKVSCTYSGRQLLDGTSIAAAISSLGLHRQLDYLSRLAITSLAFTDGGFYTKQLLVHWGGSAPGGSVELRVYTHNLMKALFRSRPREFYKWGIDVVLKHILCCSDERSARSVLRLLDEIVQDRVFLRALLAKGPAISLKNIPHANRLLIRFLAAPEGVELLSQWQWLDAALDKLLITPPTAAQAHTRPRLGSDTSTDSFSSAAVEGTATGTGTGNGSSKRALMRDMNAESFRSISSIIANGGDAAGRGRSSSVYGQSYGQANSQPSVIGPGLIDYVEQIDRSMAKALSRSYLQKANTCSSLAGIGFSHNVLLGSSFIQQATNSPSVVVPIVIPIRDISLGLPPMEAPLSNLSVISTVPTYSSSFYQYPQTSHAAAQNMNQSSTNLGVAGGLNASNLLAYTGVNSPAAAAAALASAVVFLQPSLGSEYNVPESIDLEGLLRVPWHIEVKLSSVNDRPATQSAYGMAQAVQQNLAAVEFLKVDSYLDASELASPATEDIVSNANRLIRVRGVILDARGNPAGHPVAMNRLISNCLMAGSCALHRDGSLTSTVAAVTAPSASRKRAVSTTLRGQQQEPPSTMKGGRPAPVLNVNVDNLERDLPPTFQNEHLHDWTICKPGHRQGKVIELGDGKFAVEIPGEPVVWIFSRFPSGSLSSLSSSGGNSSGSGLGGGGVGGGGGGGVVAGGNKFLTNSIWQNPQGGLGKQKKGVAIGANGTPDAASSSSSSAATRTSESLFAATTRSDTSRAGGIVYLLEVHYLIRLQTGQGMFVSIPRHILGELARNDAGMSVLDQRQAMSQLTGAARDEKSTVKARRAALWALGHIGATESGLSGIIMHDSSFLEWCVQGALTCPNYSLRGTFFHVLGLLSRSQKGSRQLSKLQWDSAPSLGNSAVAVPRNPSKLFETPFMSSSSSSASADTAAATGANSSSTAVPLPPPSATSTGGATLSPKSTAFGSLKRFPSMYISATSTATTTAAAAAAAAAAAVVAEDAVITTEDYDHTIIAMPVPPMTLPLTPFLDSTAVSVELEVLNLIAKLPGAIIEKDRKNRLDLLRHQHPEVFSNRRLYVTIHRMFEGYTFKLSARRDILKLFLPSAACKYSVAVAAIAAPVVLPPPTAAATLIPTFSVAASARNSPMVTPRGNSY